MLDAQTEKLKKLLALTTSSNDNEALIAIRQANKILKSANRTWPEIIGADLTEANSRYSQLHLKYVALAEKYNQLVAMIARHQAVAAIGLPQRRPSRRRNVRL